MLVKIAIIFLAVMVALSLFGVIRKPVRCPRCGKPRRGKTCGCGAR